MSDFDKIINDRLNEDDGELFPRKEANWDKLSQRLADFDKANPLPKDTPQPVMRPVWKRFAWMSAAAVLVGVSGLLFWHFNEVGRVKQENARLQQEVAALKQDQQSANPETILNRKVIIQSDTVYQTTKTVTQSGIANSPAKIPETQSSRDNNAPSVFEEKQGNLNKNKQNTAVVDSKINKPRPGFSAKVTYTVNKEINAVMITLILSGIRKGALLSMRVWIILAWTSVFVG